MPLPHFLLLIASVILAAGLTLWAAFASGVPLAALALVALGAALVLHLVPRDHRDPRA
ncbi:hypothetical protein KY389_04440 [Paracoccus bogoriensis]|uniref:hypothetical protein n=1 Tax=Paracoccus bogoriensis TaxID=242065 RepID=UPI001CA53622|nr:hypothetical protein [Paracoccus bogoriensis]MBW7055945.1 hypothetical protein [Paracoccus bogoriensis]